jgi:CheY-like chemotaxis protein
VLDLLQREPRIDLMLIDFAMPGMTGADVARSVHSTKPALPNTVHHRLRRSWCAAGRQ